MRARARGICTHFAYTRLERHAQCVDTLDHQVLRNRQNKSAIDGAIYYRPGAVHHINSSPVFIQSADGDRSAAGPLGGREKNSTPDDSRVYVRFLPFVSGRVHLGRLNTYSSILGAPLEPRETEAAPPCF